MHYSFQSGMSIHFFFNKIRKNSGAGREINLSGMHKCWLSKSFLIFSHCITTNVFSFCSTRKLFLQADNN